MRAVKKFRAIAAPHLQQELGNPVLSQGALYLAEQTGAQSAPPVLWRYCKQQQFGLVENAAHQCEAGGRPTFHRSAVGRDQPIVGVADDQRAFYLRAGPCPSP